MCRSVKYAGLFECDSITFQWKISIYWAPKTSRQFIERSISLPVGTLIRLQFCVRIDIRLSHINWLDWFGVFSQSGCVLVEIGWWVEQSQEASQMLKNGYKQQRIHFSKSDTSFRSRSLICAVKSDFSNFNHIYIYNLLRHTRKLMMIKV